MNLRTHRGDLYRYRLDADVRSLVISPLGNFFVGGQVADGTGSLLCGIRDTVTTLPQGFTHETIVFAGLGINTTLSGWGDVLLSVSGKPRTNPYNDFVLSHLGYWTGAKVPFGGSEGCMCSGLF